MTGSRIPLPPEIHDPRATFPAIFKEAWLNDSPIRIFYGNPVTGKDEMMEYDVAGFVRLRPWEPGGDVPQIVFNHNPESTPAPIQFERIVRLLVGNDARKAEVYCHHGYRTPYIRIADLPQPEVYVNQNREPHKTFRTLKAAERWKAFMQGKRMRP